MAEFKHLDLFDRRRIEQFLDKGKSLRYIAGKLGRSVSSISDEIKLNRVRGIYDAEKADHKAYVKRKYSKIQCMKVVMDQGLKTFVTEAIEHDQSPEGISGRLAHIGTDLQYASTKAIYKFVKSPYGRNIENHLYAKAVRKKGGLKRGTHVSIDGRVMIDQRPVSVLERLEFGHFEGDFIESGKDGKGSLLVLVERKSRYPFIRYLEDRGTASVNRLVTEMLAGIPILSLTIDNDISFQKHRDLSEMIQSEIFFCHPQSPHQKGTIENRNKAIRRYVKKRSDLSSYPKEVFAFVESRLRDKYMKCLNFKTPREVFEAELQNFEMKKATRGGMIIDSISLTASVRIGGSE